MLMVVLGFTDFWNEKAYIQNGRISMIGNNILVPKGLLQQQA